jgi:hypothetical protein
MVEIGDESPSDRVEDVDTNIEDTTTSLHNRFGATVKRERDETSEGRKGERESMCT